MDEGLRILLSGLIVFGSFVLEGITGFGCTVIALPFITMMLGLKMTVPFLCVLGMLLSLYIVSTSGKAIQWKEFFFIALYVALGMPIGMYLFNNLSPVILCIILALFMIGVGCNGTYRTVKDHNVKKNTELPRKNWLMRLILLCGGVIHGAFGTGGPFVVIYAAKALPDKALFRVTLSLLWLTMNSIRVVEWMFQGTIWSMEMGKLLLTALPFAVAGIAAGDYLHHKVDDYRFRIIVYSVLCLTGFVMLGSNIMKL